jgi:hypothetical protein
MAWLLLLLLLLLLSSARRNAPPNAAGMVLDVLNCANLSRAIPPQVQSMAPFLFALVPICAPYLTPPPPRAQTDVFLALQLMASALTNNTRCLMPPCPIEEVVWPNVKTKFSFYTTLSNTRGWVSVSGPRGSGKSLRVLSSCHSLLANRLVAACQRCDGGRCTFPVGHARGYTLLTACPFHSISWSVPCPRVLRTTVYVRAAKTGTSSGWTCRAWRARWKLFRAPSTNSACASRYVRAWDR